METIELEPEEKVLRKPQEQQPPGEQYKMEPEPETDTDAIKGSGKLNNKVALITGGDSGIGRAVAVLFAKEGADVAIVYLSEDRDAHDTRHMVEEYGRKCVLIPGDLKSEKFCEDAVEKALEKYGHIDVLVNNAGMQIEADSLEDISTENMLKTFYTNVFSVFWMTKAALKTMKKGSCIINTASVTAYHGHKTLLDYSSTKGAIVAFTRSLALNLAEKGIRVNAVAPGPIWTPLIVSSFDGDKVATFGNQTAMKRAGEPVEVASSYVFLASEDASFMTGQVLHPNGGEIVNG